MIFIILLGVLCLYLFNRYRNKIEIYDYGEWKPLKLPIGIWTIIFIVAFIPLINVIGLFIFEIFTILDIGPYGSTRFKNGESCILSKIIEFLQKEY